MKDLVKNTEDTQQALQIIQETQEILNSLPRILSRLETVKEKPLKVIDKEKLNYIRKVAKEVNPKMYIFSRQDSKTTRTFMSLQMLTAGGNTYRVLKTLLAFIERKQQAITENLIKLERESLKISKLQKEYKETKDEYKKRLIEIQIKQKAINLSNSMSYIEAALKEIGFLMEEYEQIKRNKNIPDDWSEIDYEREEIKGHIRTAFRLGIRDIIVHGRLGMGTVEYFESFGIGYLEADFHIRNYLQACNMIIDEVRNKMKNNQIDIEDIYNKLPGYNSMHDFLDKMAELYKDNYKKVCKRMGLDENILQTKFILSSENLKPISNVIESEIKDDKINE